MDFSFILQGMTQIFILDFKIQELLFQVRKIYKNVQSIYSLKKFSFTFKFMMKKWFLVFTMKMKMNFKFAEKSKLTLDIWLFSILYFLLEIQLKINSSQFEWNHLTCKQPSKTIKFLSLKKKSNHQFQNYLKKFPF